MENRMITIENGRVSVPQQSGDIRMAVVEIAALFGVYTQSVNAHIKAVLKSGVVKADISCPVTVSGNTILPDVYGLEMITALSFRIQSRNTEIFRKWLLGKAFKAEIPEMLIRTIQNPILN